ncbi:hypothetical protein ACFL4W_03660, partial [Planctomycetota bacterium]
DGELFEAYTRYRELVLDFKGLLETNALAERTITLRDTRTVTDELARQAEEQQHDDRIREKVRENILAIKKAIARQNPEELDRMLKDLRAKAVQKENEKEREIAWATFQQLLLFYDDGFKHLAAGRHQEAIIHLALALEAAPKHPEINYNLACAYALSDKKGLALKYLQRAVENGYDKTEHIEKDDDFNNIRKEEGYLEIIRKLKEGRKEKEITE